MFGLFRKPTADERRQADLIKAIVRVRLSLDDAATVSVSEIQCGDASCPGTDTVILVMAPGQKTRAYKVLSPIAEVDDAAVARALAGTAS